MRFFPQNFPEFQGKIQECIDKASHIIAISQSTKHDILKFYKTDKPITVIHHGLNDSFHRFCLIDCQTIQLNLDRLKIQKQFILFVGGRRLYKNFISLLKAYAYSRVSNNFNWLVVGSENYLYDDEKKL